MSKKILPKFTPTDLYLPKIASYKCVMLQFVSATWVVWKIFCNFANGFLRVKVLARECLCE